MYCCIVNTLIFTRVNHLINSQMIAPGWLHSQKQGAVEYSFALFFRGAVAIVLLSHITCQLTPGVLSPASTHAITDGVVLSPEVCLDSPRWDFPDENSSRRAGKGSPEWFCPGAESGFWEMRDVCPHTPFSVPPAWREGQVDSKHQSVLQKVLLQDLAAGAFSALIQPSFFFQSWVT